MLRTSTLTLSMMLLLTPCAAQERTGRATNAEVELAYWIHGAETGVPLVVINGQGAATRTGGDGLTASLLDRGFRVVLFDNRDSGQSTVLSASHASAGTKGGVEMPDAGKKQSAAYDLSDMADDTIAVLDAAGIERAHIVGHSLGAMVAQVLAAEHPERVLSLISVSSTSGEPDLPFGPAMAVLSKPPVEMPETVADQQVWFYRLFEGSAYRMTDGEVSERVAADMTVQDPEAAARQTAAVSATGDRRKLLRTIKLPALVVHGGDDPWFPLAHAESTSAALGGARVEVIDGMGHILPDAAAGIVAARIADFIQSLPPS